MTDRTKLRIAWIIATAGFAIWLLGDHSHSDGLVMLGSSLAALGLIGLVAQTFLSRVGNHKA